MVTEYSYDALNRVVTESDTDGNPSTYEKIVTMKGFDKLSLEQQPSVLNFEENFIGLSKSANTSKGAKSYSDWTMYKKTNTSINPIFREEMIRKEAILEGKLQSMIDNFIYDK